MNLNLKTVRKDSKNSSNDKKTTYFKKIIYICKKICVVIETKVYA